MQRRQSGLGVVLRWFYLHFGYLAADGYKQLIEAIRYLAEQASIEKSQY